MPMGGFRAQPRKKHKKIAIRFRTQMPDDTNYPKDDYNWEYIYGSIREKIPYNMPSPKGREVKITMFADVSLF